MRLSFIDVVCAMRSGTKVKINGNVKVESGVYIGNIASAIINGIEREDGSGRSWIVSLTTKYNGRGTIYWHEEKMPDMFESV